LPGKNVPSDLFEPVISPDSFHPQFSDLRNSPFHGPARQLMNELHARMGDPERNFVQDFQGAGFHARAVEICCYAYLEEAGMRIERSFAFPDFIARRDGVAVAIEVVTSNPSDLESRDVSAARMEPLTDEEVDKRASTDFPRKVLRGLSRKARRNYQQHAHVGGLPLVVLVSPFHEAGSNFYIDESLLPALFPLDPEGLETPFFFKEGTENISAVAYCNAFTVSKCFRMADPGFVAANFIAERSGSAFFEGRSTLHGFRYHVGHPATPIETWFEGITMIINPNAAVPLPDGLLPASSTFSVVGDRLERSVRGFHPLASTMIVGRRR
jgi:hypothetical protein